MKYNNVFQQMANRYDTEERIKIAQIIVKEIRSGLADTKGKTALDYGCGTGLIGLGLIDLFSSVIFADASPQMIEQVKQKIRDGRIETAAILCCDFIEAPPTIQVDYVIMSQVLLHIKDTGLILSRVFDAIKQSGHLIIVDFDKNERITNDKVYNGFEQKELVCLAKQIGFSSADSHTFYRGQKILMNEDASMFILNAKK